MRFCVLFFALRVYLHQKSVFFTLKLTLRHNQE